MSINRSQTERINSIFKGNSFVIPTYQRKYSWTDEERKELWQDIQESINDDMNHFVGTICLKENKTVDLSSTETVYEIIDGQQRIITIFILLSVLIDSIKDTKVKEIQRNAFIGSDNNLKIQPLGGDGEFLKSIIFNYDKIDVAQVKKRSQILMYSAKKEYLAFVKPLSSEEIEQTIIFILNKIELLVSNVESQAQAVKMFSIINDRGLPLRILDKTKSILMLYSTMHLKERLNPIINDSFEIIFDSYDDIFLLKDKLGILGGFEENTIFTQHYYSAKTLFPETWHYKDSADTIFKNLKSKCQDSKNNKDELETFILNYVVDLANFAANYSSLIKEIENKIIYQKPFRFLGYTATLYPLIIRLYSQKKLDELLAVLELTEVRVFKLTGTNAIKDIYLLSSEVAFSNLDIEEIKQRLIEFNQKFMPDFNFKNFLGTDIATNRAVKYIVSEYNNDQLSINQYNNLQVEHIFSVDPEFEPSSYGFVEGYDYEKDRIGNLGLLEENINKGIGNKPPIHKVNGYLKSIVENTRNLAGEIQKGNYSKTNVDERRERIIEFCIDRFKLS
jgi:uncharacterized protein with ParB-like and HNH nuclease domain